MDNKTMLLILMIVLIVFIVLLAVLGIVFIIALRKRAPVVKVVIAPNTDNTPQDHKDPIGAPNADATDSAEASCEVPPEESGSESELEAETETDDADIDDDTDEDDDEKPIYVTEGTERVTYKRSLTARIAQLNREAKEWYSELKNELLSYDKVKARMSWRHETFRIGRMAFARIIVRGKTLRLLLAVEPAGYSGTKFIVEDVSNIASMADTPTMYRIKNPRRVRFAKEMIAGMMKELKCFKDPRYEAQDYFIPYEGDMAFMQRGLVKRIVSGTVRTYKIEEVDKSVQDEAAATEDNGGETE